MKKIICAVLLLGGLTGCSSLKEAAGLERTAPDEFRVVEQAPLTLPPNFNALPTPGDMTTGPVAPDARGLVLGSQPSAPAAVTQSRAEQMLLNKAGAANAQPAIRQQLYKEKDVADPKSTAEKLGITAPSGQGKALNAVDEAQRLQQQNIKTPAVKIPADTTKK